MNKAVIYDRWLSTLGGAEVVAGTMAEALEESYKVLLLSDEKVPKENIQRKLGLQLTETELLPIWRDEEKLYKYAKTAEVFINVSFMDYSFARARKNLYYVHFPTSDQFSTKNRFKERVILPFLQKIIPYYPLFSSISVENRNNRDAYRVSKRPLILRYSSLKKGQSYTVVLPLYFQAFSFTQMNAVKIRLEGCSSVQKKVVFNHLTNVSKFTYSFRAEESVVAIYIEAPKVTSESFTLTSQNFVIEPMLYSNSWFQHLPYKVMHRIEIRLKAGVYTDFMQRLQSYDVILANSEFTARWIRKYWGKKSTVLYSPVTFLSSRKKKNWICSVGRFFTLGHGKKQEVMIQAFREFYDKGNTDWELHLVGGFDANDQNTVDYIHHLESLSQGYPIYFHLNVSRKELSEVVGASKLYWHSAGYGETDPIKMEHFGISVVESMSAGCLPILFNNGGLPEILEKLGLSTSKHTFESIEELVEKTEYWVKNYSKYKHPSQALFKKNFSRERFTQELTKILATIK